MIVATYFPNNFFFPSETAKSFIKIKNKIITVQSCSGAENRNIIIERAKMAKDDVLIIDADMVFTPWDVDRIEKHLETYDIVTGLCLMPTGTPAIFKWSETTGDYIPMKPEKGIFQVDACGSAFKAISKRIYDKIPANPFNNMTFLDGMTLGPDISFCHRMREQGIKIYCDSDIKIGHLRIRVIKP